MRIRSTLGVAALTLALAGCATGGGSGTSTAISAPVNAPAHRSNRREFIATSTTAMSRREMANSAANAAASPPGPGFVTT